MSLRLLARIAALAALGAAVAPACAQALPDDWDQRDLEGKWVVYRRDCEANQKDANRKKRWADLLAERREFGLLETIALHEGWRFAGKALAQADAPQTFRVAQWNLGAFDSHNRDNAEQALRDRAAEARRWFETYPQAQRGKGRAFFAALDVAPDRAAPTQLPPLDPLQVLVPSLDAPAELQEFGDRLTAEPRVVYLHQVLRALDGVLVYGDVDAQLVPKVVALGRHRDPRVYGAAFATLTKMPGDLLPDELLLRQVDGDGSQLQRRVAATALSFAAHPRAFFALVRIAQEPAHPAAEIAQHRVVDLGDPGAAALLDDLAERVPVAAGEAPRELLRGLAVRIRARVALLDVTQVAAVRPWFERAAWLAASGDARAGVVGPAVVELLQRVPEPARTQLIADLRADAPRSPFRGEERDSVRRAMGELLRAR